jgi:long-chain acyl-CoA synthetase
VSRVIQALADHATRTPGRIALSSEGGRYTYAALDAAVRRASVALMRIDAARSGRPVAILLENSPAWVILDLALVRLGCPSLPLPGFFTAAQRRHALDDAGAAALVTAGESESDFLNIAGVPLHVESLRSRAGTLPRGTAKVTYTSGSTGWPKGVCLSLDQMESVAASLVAVIGADYAGRHLPVLPLSILLENVAGLYVTVLAGGEYRVLSPSTLGLEQPFQPDIARLACAVAGQGATSLILPPELLRALLMVMVFTGARFPQLNFVAVGGSKVAPGLLSQAAGVGLPVYEGYGLSECASVVALNTPSSCKVGSVGRPLRHLSVQIAADGEIIVGSRPFLGYANGAAREGPVRTGDLGRLDAEGFLHIDGRRTNTIITTFGRNVAPEWVESELLAQPEIRQALVFGDGQAELGALIVPLTPTMAEEAVARAIDRANQALPAYARVGRWRLRGPFDPAAGELTANGRPRRAAILNSHPDFITAPGQGDQL